MVNANWGSGRHKSFELSHSYAKDFTLNTELDTQRLGKELYMAHLIGRASLQPGDTMSTVHMVDDYHIESRPEKRLLRPAEVLQRIVDSAGEYNVPLDYIALEGGFVPLAQEFLEQAIRPNAPVVNGREENSAWLYCRTTFGEKEETYEFIPPALQQNSAYTQEKQREPSRGAQELWVEMFNYKRNKKGKLVLENGVPVIEEWACPYLSAMFLAARLGAVTHKKLTPQLVDVDNLPDYETWESYSPILQINPDAKRFVGDSAVSCIDKEYVAVEDAAVTIASAIDHTVRDRYELGVFA